MFLTLTFINEKIKDNKNITIANKTTYFSHNAIEMNDRTIWRLTIANLTYFPILTIYVVVVVILFIYFYLFIVE